jgi:hypothetical protein
MKTENPVNAEQARFILGGDKPCEFCVNDPKCAHCKIATNTVSSSGVINVTDTFSDLGGPPASAYYRLGWSP